MNANASTNSGHNPKSKIPYGGHWNSGQWNNRNRLHQKWNIYERYNKYNVAKKMI